MVCLTAVLLVSTPFAPRQPRQGPPGPPDMSILKSKKLRRATLTIPNNDDTGRSAACTIRGDGITVDFNGTTLFGTSAEVDPDKRVGAGVRIVGKNVTIENAHVHGYKIGLIARNCPGLRILNCDFSYNWKQRLMSTIDREDESDWQSYHHNENEEWLRYGAGIYLQDCNRFEVKGTRIVGGQCGLMLTRCEHGLAWNNDFSFNSGLGIGMYRSSDNRIMHNKCDWDVRGFSYKVYNRGQDSAGILVFEQCMRNVFAYNSVTHGGDGFFLWAGQHTMDTGDGGCNDNVLYGNDFSYAVANGIEATFSRNKFVNNRCVDCWHGIWGGYSYDTSIQRNTFGRNDPAIGDEQAIAIEHGQNDSIVGNRFLGDSVGIAIWADRNYDANWAYAKARDVSSKDYRIADNDFHTQQFSIDARNTSASTVSGNTFAFPGSGLHFGDAVDAKVAQNVFRGEAPALPSPIPVGNRAVVGLPTPAAQWNPFERVDANDPKPMVGGQRPFLPAIHPQGWKYILVDEWGPFDFRSPRLWPRSDVPATAGSGATVKAFETMGPRGRWKLESVAPKCEVSPTSGVVGDTIHVTMPAGKAANFRLKLSYVGVATTDYRGIATPAGRTVPFEYREFFAPIDWDVKFYKWDAATDPRTQLAAFDKMIQGPAIRELKTDKLDFAGQFVIGEPAVPNDYFADVSEGEFTIAPGDYTLEVVTDDGCRVWLDGKMVVKDAWKYQGPTLYSVNVRLGGKHHIRVEHFQIDGYAALKVNLRPKR